MRTTKVENTMHLFVQKLYVQVTMVVDEVLFWVLAFWPLLTWNDAKWIRWRTRRGLPEPEMIITQFYHWHALNNCMPL